jgi:hypothetical protein
MHCPKCGIENPDNAQVCSSCGSELPKVSINNDVPATKVSSLAIAAFVLGILSLFSCGLTILPAIILGVISFVVIEKSGGRLTGQGLAIIGIIMPVIIFFVLILPPLRRARFTAFNEVCRKNLMNIGKAIQIYANDYDGIYPRSGGKDSIWRGHIADWRADNRFNAYGLRPDGTGGYGNISSCFYLLVKYCDMTPKSFICKGDKGAKEFKPSKEGAGSMELTDLWDFGQEASKHCSYSYQMPFSQYALTIESKPGMVVAADRNPWQDSPASTAKQFPGNFKPDGGRKAVRTGNAIAHQEYFQNVLFVDCHVGSEIRSFCGINDDNIYTFWSGGDIRIGAPPLIGSEPQDRLDSLLVDDGP